MCTSPLDGWRSKDRNPDTGKRRVVFRKAEADLDAPWVSVPCGRCMECRLEKKRQWAMRCMHEASLYDDNCFVTLTYDDAHLPPFGSLDYKEPDDLQIFLKALRQKYAPRRIRFFGAGEYGDLGRPHYHLLLFNHVFGDEKRWSVRNCETVYRSDTLEKLWKKGQSEIGSVTFESAAYCAKYVQKDRDYSPDPYFQFMLNSGLWRPDFGRMSRRPGIGKEFAEKYASEIMLNDSVIVNGREVKPPKFYMDQYEDLYPEAVFKIKANRKKGQPAAVSTRELEARDANARAAVELFSGGRSL